MAGEPSTPALAPGSVVRTKSGRNLMMHPMMRALKQHSEAPAGGSSVVTASGSTVQVACGSSVACGGGGSSVACAGGSSVVAHAGTSVATPGGSCLRSDEVGPPRRGGEDGGAAEARPASPAAESDGSEEWVVL